MGKFNRFMTKDTLVSQVDFGDPTALIESFRQRVDGWYFEPIAEWPRTGHEAFVALLAVKHVVYTAANVLFPGDDLGPNRVLEFADTVFAESPGEDPRTAADRFLSSVSGLGSGELKMAETEGISGTGHVWVLANGGVLVFDPWVIRDRLSQWFNDHFSDLAANPESELARQAAEVLRKVFQREPITGSGNDGGPEGSIDAASDAPRD